ncbi:MAG: LysR family transcriptional regulator, partial [Pseudomonadota bacterium]
RAASETIGYTQSAITKILHRIEEEFGERLFERHPRGMRLNEFGLAFLEHSLAIDKEIRDAKSKIAALKSGETGRVVLGTAAWSTQMLPEILSNIVMARPNLKFRVVAARILPSFATSSTTRAYLVSIDIPDDHQLRRIWR